MGSLKEMHFRRKLTGVHGSMIRNQAVLSSPRSNTTQRRRGLKWSCRSLESQPGRAYWKLNHGWSVRRSFKISHF